MGKYIVVIVSILFIALAFAAITDNSIQAVPTNQNSVSTASPALNSTSAAQSKLQALENTLEAKGIPLKYASMPSFLDTVHRVNGTIEPSYTSAPAPMGIGFYGTKNVSGQTVGYNLTTSSVMASLNIKNMSDFYLLNDGPTSETFQLNSVLTNVTLFGNSSYTFWTQNVVFYSAREHNIQFLVNIWNFSSPAVAISSNVFQADNGILCAPTFYYGIGPTINVTQPFTLNMYLNSTVVDGNSAIFFNYSLNTANLTTSGNINYAIFNSTYGQPANYSAIQPEYLASGTVLTPTGYIPYDFEIMVGGPGGGSTTSIYNVNATLNLMYRSNGIYHNVPSAYDVGSETGETSEGVSVSWDNSTAYLSPGPSLIYPMWNLSSSNSMSHYSGKLSPSNSFMFVSPSSTFNSSTAAWVPLSQSGEYNFTVPSGIYSAVAMLSDYQPVFFAPGQSVALMNNYFMGIYTPLVAFNNAQLKNISIAGDGTANNPYILVNNQYMPVNSLFEEFNDYGFPVFPGVMILNTNASVIMYNMPSMFIQYTSGNSYYQAIQKAYELPSYNDLNYELYNASNITLWKSHSISGYFSYSLSGFPVANLVIWNSTNILVGANQFNVIDSGILVYKSPNVTIWGNYLYNSPQLYNSTFAAITNIWGAPLGLAEYSSGDTIYNNFFDVEITAYSPSESIYSGNSAVYIDRWNITKQPAYIVHYVNGFALSGSILFTNYQGGNYWYNYNGTGMYNNNGLIEYGGDYAPLYYSFFMYYF
ncbi:MAG: thermopsin family protease [Ferroplasma sp.]